MQDRYPLGVHEFARLARKSPDTIRALARAGKIQCHRRGPRGWIFFTEDDVQAFLQQTLVPALPVAEPGAAGGPTSPASSNAARPRSPAS